jgi:hypothetical protein
MGKNPLCPSPWKIDLVEYEGQVPVFNESTRFPQRSKPGRAGRLPKPLIGGCHPIAQRKRRPSAGDVFFDFEDRNQALSLESILIP